MATDFKEKYKDHWVKGQRREKLFKSFMEAQGFRIITNGFMAMQVEYNQDYSDVAGIPDFKSYISNNPVYFEVTGTDNTYITPGHNIWVRPDKIKYIVDNGFRGFIVHFLDGYNFLMRFIDINAVDWPQVEVINPIIKGSVETYYSIEPKFSISSEEIIGYIKGLKNVL